MTKMIPPVPTSAVMMPTPKQKIGFSIESIVGNDATPSTNSPNMLLSKTDSLPQQLTHHQSHLQQQRHDIQDFISRLHNSTNNMLIASHNNLSPPPGQTRLTPDEHASPPLKRARSPSPLSSTPTSPPQHSPQQNLCSMNKQSPIVVPGMPPGLIRPFPVPPPNMPDIKAIPPYIGSPEMVAPQHNPHLLAAAQFQMAAALQAGHVLGPGGLPPHAQFLPNPGMTRESYPLYPWLLTRHGRIFPHRFPGNFLLQPFRKPKRIRTAFSPSQLLKLEHAFESNQYVVGAERKALAQSLNLSETQVKVWFQNRRTKHKRMQQEDEKGSGNGKHSSNSERNTSGASGDEDDDELIDMEMDDCPSDDEVDGHQ